MCRFLVVKSQKSINPQPLLNSFAAMAEKSRAFDGDWQGDGWGISWLDKNNHWQLYKSLKPVWKEVQPALPARFAARRAGRSIDKYGLTKIFLVHARSASFLQHKDNIEFNQPFIDESYSYVFNGLLKGVTLSLLGSIGAQKIWHLLKNQLKKYDPLKALERTKIILLKNSKELQATNIAFSDKKNIYTLCYYSKHEQYYQLHHHIEKDFQFISSEPLSDYPSTQISTNQIISI